MLYDVNSAVMLLKCFCHSPHLIISNKYSMDVSDWELQGVEEATVYAVLYRVIYNLAIDGASSIVVGDVTEYLNDYPQYLQLCQMYNYEALLATDVDGLNMDTIVGNIDVYYLNVRKFSMLRSYKNAGFNISSIYDELKDDASQLKKLHQTSLAEIANQFEVAQTEIKNKFVHGEDIEHYVIGTDFENTKKLFATTPMIGYAFQSGYLNEMLNGIQGLTIVSAASGVGKSSMSVGDCCMNGAKQLWDEEKGWYDNPSYMGSTLFINTEMEIRTELDSMFIAFVSKVPRQHITRNEYEEGEEERVDYAAEMFKQYKIYSTTMPNYTCEMLEETINEYVTKYNIKLVCFDYIYTNTAVSNEISKTMQLNAREDLILQEVTTKLKELSLKHNIHIRTSTQLNRKAQEEHGIPDESYIAGSVGIVRKANNFAVIQPMTQRLFVELEPFEAIMDEGGKPTHVITVVKGRNSAYPKQSRVFVQMDLGTLRMKDLFVVDRDNQWLDVTRRNIIAPIKEDENERYETDIWDSSQF